MKRSLLTLISLVVIAAALVARAQGREGADPGVTRTSITIGGTVPLTGVAAAYGPVGRGAEAYFKYVNANGGVNGRRIVYRYLDDAYNPTTTLERTRRLVQGGAFAIFNSVGTEHNLSTRPYLNQSKVPQVFVASSAGTFGTESKRYPYTLGYGPTYLAEGRMYGQYLAAQRPGARIAVLSQNDDYGREVVAGLTEALGTRARIVAQEAYEVSAPDVSVSQKVATLRDSGAGVLVLVATPAFAIRAYTAADKLAWKPLVLVGSVSAGPATIQAADDATATVTEGSLTIGYLKDPSDPRWATDAGGRLYRQIVQRYGVGGNPNDVLNVYGMAAAHSFVGVLRRAGKTPTREGLLRAVSSLNERGNPFLLPGIHVRTTVTDRFPIEQARLQRWTNGRWVGFGPVLSAAG